MNKYVPYVIEDAAGARIEIQQVPLRDMERWQIEAPGVPWLSRTQMQELHVVLSVMLGLDVSAMTFDGFGEATSQGDSTNEQQVMVEQPDGSGDAARRV